MTPQEDWDKGAEYIATAVRAIDTFVSIYAMDGPGTANAKNRIAADASTIATTYAIVGAALQRQAEFRMSQTRQARLDAAWSKVPL